MPDGMRRPSGPTPWDQRLAIRDEAAKLIARLGPNVTRRQVANALGLHHGAVQRHYPTDADLLYEVVDDHLHGLFMWVWQEFQAATPSGPVPALEAMIRAWLRRVREEWQAHHALRTATHLLPEEHRETVRRNYRNLLRSMQEALVACLPALADRKEAAEAVTTCFHRLLADVSWPYDPYDCAPEALARRIAGMVLAAAQAELAGAWPELGATAGLRGNRTVMESAQVRAGFSTALATVAQGGEVVVTRYGRRIAKLVPAG